LTKLAQPAAFAIAAFFSLLAAVAAGGGLAVPVLLCLVGALAIRPSVLKQGLKKRPLVPALVLTLAIWSIITTAWSPLPMDDQVYKLAVLVPLGLMFVASATADPQTRRLTAAGALAACVVLAPLLGIEALWNMPLNRAGSPNEPVDQLWRLGGHGTTILLALAWSAAAGLIGGSGMVRKAGALVILVSAAVLSAQFEQLANAVAFGVGVVGFIGGWIAPRVMLLATSGGLALWLIVSPFVAPLLAANARLSDALPFSAAHRIGIWTYISGRVWEQPLFGHGLEASRVVTDRLDIQDRNVMATPVHPHSASLQIWFETGAIGALLAAAALIAGGLWLAHKFRNDRPAAAAACATLASLGFIANVSYGIWAEWWMATLFVGAAAVGAVRKS
jgi:O-antigen ligase